MWMKNMNNNNKTVTGLCSIICCPYFSHPYFIKATTIINQQPFHKLLKCKPCVGAKLVLRNSYISWSINTIFVPRIGMYIRINIPRTVFIYLHLSWCNSVIFCHGPFFYSSCTFANLIWNHSKFCLSVWWCCQTWAIFIKWPWCYTIYIGHSRILEIPLW